MGVLSEIQEAVKLAQKADNVDLYRRILDLQAEVQELVQEKRNLEDQVAELEEALEFQDSLVPVGDVYGAKEHGEIVDGPFCTRCWDVNAQAVRLRAANRKERQMIGRIKVCPECDSHYRATDEVNETFQ